MLYCVISKQVRIIMSDETTSKQPSLKEEIKDNKAKFKDLSFKGKINFIKDYYKLHIYAVIFVILLIGAIIWTVRDNNYNTVINVIITNNTVIDWVSDEDALETYIINGYVAHSGVDNVSDRVFVNDYFLVADARDSELSAINSQTLTAMFSGKEIDVYFGDNKSLDYFASDIDPFFYDLTLILDEQFLEKISDIIVYYTFKNGDKMPYALDVTNTSFAKAAGFVNDEVYLAIPNNTERLEASLDFISYVFSVD